MTLTIDCERLFDGDRLVEGARVVVDGERIVRVEPPGAGEAGTNGRRIACRFAMPGLIDAHVHVSGYVEGSPAGVPFKPMKSFMRLLVLNGVTTVRDTGNAIETIHYLREWGEKYHGPRIVAAGPLLDAPPLMWPFSRIVRDREAAHREVGRLHLEGMDFIKSYRNITGEVLAEIVAAAGERGMDVAADVHAATALTACRLGVRSLEHAANLVDERSLGVAGDGYGGAQGRARLWSRVDLGSPLVAELVAELAARRTFVCPTLLVSHRWCDLEAMVHEPYLDYMVAVMPYHQYFKRMRSGIGMAIGRRLMQDYLPVPKPSRGEKREIDAGLATLRAMVGLLHRSGVRLVAGTDAPNPSIVPGFSLHREMALLAEAGLPPTAVLAAATSAAADLLRRADLGRIAPGALADLLLLDGDPTADLGQTMNVRAVVKGGVEVDRERVLAKFKAGLDGRG